jgi:hypothetical protein
MSQFLAVNARSPSYAHKHTTFLPKAVTSLFRLYRNNHM